MSAKNVEQALIDLLSAFSELEQDLEDIHADNEDSYNAAIVETLEAGIENAIEESDTSTSLAATLVSSLSEALETLDPSAFDDDAADEFGFSMAGIDDGGDDDDIDLDDDDDDIDDEDDE